RLIRLVAEIDPGRVGDEPIGVLKEDATWIELPGVGAGIGDRDAEDDKAIAAGGRTIRTVTSKRIGDLIDRDLADLGSFDTDEGDSGPRLGVTAGGGSACR